MPKNHAEVIEAGLTVWRMIEGSRQQSSLGLLVEAFVYTDFKYRTNGEELREQVDAALLDLQSSSSSPLQLSDLQICEEVADHVLHTCDYEKVRIVLKVADKIVIDTSYGAH